MTSASESIRKNRRTWAARPPAQGGTVERPTVAVVNDQPEPGESCEGGAESESADRQAEDSQGR